MAGVFFWVLMLLLLLGSGYVGFGPNGNRWYGGVGVVCFLLFLLLGLKVFGFHL